MDECRSIIIDLEDIDEIIEYVQSLEIKGSIDWQIGYSLVELLETLKGEP